jgi:2-polyprenyl-3-methyl-5-hydroxy-6-metoxy-1,4-benzoquinol methylase
MATVLADGCLQLDACPACGSARLSTVYRKSFKGRDWALSRCDDCGQHFTNPRPSEAVLGQIYNADYHAELRTPGGAERAFGTKYERYLRMLSRFLPKGRALDIGCSTGLLVRMLKDRGYDAEGIELHKKSAEWGRGHYGVTIHDEPLEKLPLKEGSYDAVFLTDVLEHTQHPPTFLATVRKLLSPGGYVLVTFPDIRSLESRYLFAFTKALKRPWLWGTCHIPGHIWEFTRPTATAMFEKGGFKVVAFGRGQVIDDTPIPAMLKAVRAPLNVLRVPGVASKIGTQMEFLIQKQPGEPAPPMTV